MNHDKIILYSEKSKFLKNLLTVGLASVAFLYFNSAYAAQLVGFESDGNKFERTHRQALNTQVTSEQVWLTGDFDGDGYGDLVTISKKNNKASVLVHRSNNADYVSGIPQELDAGFWGGQRRLVGDFNQDEIDDLALIYSYEGIATAWIYTSTGLRFFNHPYSDLMQCFGRNNVGKPAILIRGESQKSPIERPRSRSYIHLSSPSFMFPLLILAVQSDCWEFNHLVTCSSLSIGGTTG